MKIRFAYFAMIAIGAAALSASATSLVRLSLDQLTQAASVVLKGHVVAQATQWNAAHTRIVTLTTIAVDQNIKGNTPSEVVIEQMGGTVGHMHLFVPGGERFYPQARYELFLQPGAANPSHYLLVGMREGAYRIYRDPATHQERVINPMGNVFYRQSSGAGPAAPSTMPLDEFQQQVSKAMSHPIAIPSGTAIVITVRSVSFAGTGRVQLEASTSEDLFPNSSLVIPAGSVVDGWGQESAGGWTLHWSQISIRGSHARILAENHAATVSGLQGQRMTVITK